MSVPVAAQVRLPYASPHGAAELRGHLSSLQPVDHREGAGRRVAVVAHGLLGRRQQHFYPSLAEGLLRSARTRIDAVAAFDFAGTGASSGSYEMAGYDDEVKQLRCIADALAGWGWQLCALIGHSRGANVVLLYAARQRLPASVAVVAVAPRYHLAAVPSKYFSATEIARPPIEWCVGRRTLTVTQADLDWFARAKDMAAACAAIGDAHLRQAAAGLWSLLIAHGGADEVIPVSDAAAFANALLPLAGQRGGGSGHALRAELALLPAADHCFTTRNGAPGSSALETAVVAFVERHSQLEERPKESGTGVDRAAARRRAAVAVVGAAALLLLGRSVLRTAVSRL